MASVKSSVCSSFENYNCKLLVTRGGVVEGICSYYECL